jgi:hypothetical protein
VERVRRTDRARERASRREDDLTDLFMSHYPDVQYRLVQFVVEHLSDVGRAFKGDLQAALVLAVIGQVYLNAVRSRDGAAPDPATLPTERISTSATRIADVTGIPRQTVRRKLEFLENRGWVVRNADSTYCLAVQNGQSAAKRDLHDTDARGLRRLARLFTDLERLVERHEADAGGDPPTVAALEASHARRRRSSSR